MKRRIYMETEAGERDVRDVWNGRIDEYVDMILCEIENGGALTYSKLEKIYRYFNDVAGIDERFELVYDGNIDEVMISWPDIKWKSRFTLR